MLLKLLLLTTLTSCGGIHNYIMRPSGEVEIRDCVYHYYGRLPKCKNYNFLPVDEGVVIIPKRPVVVNNYSQYRGK